MARAKSTHLINVLIKILIVSVIAMLVLLPFHAFLSTWGGTTIGPLLIWKSWKEILLLGLLPIAIWVCILRPDITRTLWSRWVNKLILIYAVLTVGMAVFSDASYDAIVAGLLMNLRFLALFLLVQIIVASEHSWVPGLKRWLSPVLLAITFIIAVLAILQVSVLPKDFLANFGYNKDTTIAPYVLVDENPNAVRAFATMRGPNTLAAYLLLPMALAACLLLANRRDYIAATTFGLSLAALAFTGSRSAWIGAAAMLALIAFVWLPRDKLRKWLKWGTIPAILLGMLTLWAAVNIPQVRLVVFHSSPGDSSLTEGSSDQHWISTVNGIHDALAHPFGQGVGTAGPASFYNTNAPTDLAENYYVQIAQEVGILGLALFVAFSVFTWRMLWLRRNELWPRALLASFFGIAVINVLLHGWADDPTAMTWWAIAGLFLAQDKQKR